MNTEQKRADFEAWRRKHYDYDDLTAFEIEFAFAAFQAGRAALQESLDKSQDQKDAERYRRLREGQIDDIAVVRGLGATDYGASVVIGTYEEEIDGDDLDEAIDHACRIEEDGE